MGTALHAELVVDAIERACLTAASPDELLAELSSEVRRAIPHDGAAWFGVDPVTMLAAAPSRVEALDPALCVTFWHLEFHEQDAGIFTDLARGDGVAALRLSLDDRPSRSIRYRDFMRPQGYEDELRAALSVGGSTWGFVGLYREPSHRPFDEDDLALMRRISGSIACALRRHVRELSPWLGHPSSPGLVVVDRSGHILTANAEAIGWLREIWPTSTVPNGEDQLYALRDTDLEVPTALFALAARARAVADGRERAAARLRLRDRRGRWLVLHASVLAGAATPGEDAVAIVIEAAKSAEVAPIIIDAFSLTSRERDVVGALSRGGSTAEIAAELFLSPHTVRDYVKTVFEKVGVSSRGELVARLFGEHYADPLHSRMVDVP